MNHSVISSVISGFALGFVSIQLGLAVPAQAVTGTVDPGAPVKGGNSYVVHRGTVKRIPDGDTLHFTLFRTQGSEVLKARLVGIDAPEYHFPTEAGPVVGQGHWGADATEYLKTLLPVGTRATLNDFGKDKYGRTLGRLTYKGRDINLELVEGGYAVPYFYCIGEDCTTDFFERNSVPRYVEGCESAQKRGLGIFNKEAPLKEMPYDFRRRMNNRQASSWVGNFRTRELFRPEDQYKVPVCDRVFFTSESDARRIGFR